MSERERGDERVRREEDEERRASGPNTDARGAEGYLEGEDEISVQRVEEELQAGTEERQVGAVRVRKKVNTEREQVRVPKRREEVSVERVPMEGREAASEAEIGEDEIVMQVLEEEIVVQKRVVVKEEIRIRKDVVEEEEVVEADVRREEVEIEDATEHGRGLGGDDVAERPTDHDQETRRRER